MHDCTHLYCAYVSSKCSLIFRIDYLNLISHLIEFVIFQGVKSVCHASLSSILHHISSREEDENVDEARSKVRTVHSEWWIKTFCFAFHENFCQRGFFLTIKSLQCTSATLSGFHFWGPNSSPAGLNFRCFFQGDSPFKKKTSILRKPENQKSLRESLRLTKFMKRAKSSGNAEINSSANAEVDEEAANLLS